MRLIDADALSEMLVKTYEKAPTEKALLFVALLLKNNEQVPTVEGETIIKCKDCKYQVKEWREDKRMKDNGYWVYGCEHFGEIMGYWGFGGNDNEFCSDAEQKGGVG